MELAEGPLGGYSRNRFRFHIRQTYVLRREDSGRTRLKGAATHYEFHTLLRFLLPSPGEASPVTSAPFTIPCSR